MGLIGGLVLSLGAVTGHAEQVVPANRQQVTLTFAPVVKQAAPAVVNIYTRKVVQNQVPALFNDPFFRRFFGNQPGLGGERVQNSLGSGVIVRSSGIVITNNHVASDADQINVVLSDRREYAAKLVGKDERSDLAVLQLQGVTDPLPALDLAESDNVEVGDMVLAIGNPFGVGQTVTSGIVSALGRNQLGINVFESFIQTDAAINPGNSGGALVDADGRLVGINTAIFSRSGGSLGIGFAIPVDVARQVATALLKDGVVARGWIGVQTRELTPELAEALNLGDGKSQLRGVLIGGVVTDAPAAKAGIKPGDVLTRIGEHPVVTPADLLASVAALKPLSQVDVAVQRAGKALNFHLAVAQRPRPQRASEED
jgi:serine protease DegQ